MGHRTGDLQKLFDHMMQELGLWGIGCFIVDLFPIPAADDQPAGFQDLQVMGYGGAAHVHHGGDIDDTFLAVAQDPEDAKAGAVPQQLEEVRQSLKSSVFGMQSVCFSRMAPWSWGSVIWFMSSVPFFSVFYSITQKSADRKKQELVFCYRPGIGAVGLLYVYGDGFLIKISKKYCILTGFVYNNIKQLNIYLILER